MSCSQVETLLGSSASVVSNMNYKFWLPTHGHV